MFRKVDASSNLPVGESKGDEVDDVAIGAILDADGGAEGINRTFNFVPDGVIGDPAIVLGQRPIEFFGDHRPFFDWVDHSCCTRVGGKNTQSRRGGILHDYQFRGCRAEPIECGDPRRGKQKVLAIDQHERRAGVQSILLDLSDCFVKGSHGHGMFPGKASDKFRIALGNWRGNEDQDEIGHVVGQGLCR
ncbi:MAG: hypothetical protein EBU70_08085 [Actinobacteria bacterium]|nr:hypothetical protein [Actinomycetota bacterium]